MKADERNKTFNVQQREIRELSQIAKGNYDRNPCDSLDCIEEMMGLLREARKLIKRQIKEWEND